MMSDDLRKFYQLWVRSDIQRLTITGSRLSNLRMRWARTPLQSIRILINGLLHGSIQYGSNLMKLSKEQEEKLERTFFSRICSLLSIRIPFESRIALYACIKVRSLNHQRSLALLEWWAYLLKHSSSENQQYHRCPLLQFIVQQTIPFMLVKDKKDRRTCQHSNLFTILPELERYNLVASIATRSTNVPMLLDYASQPRETRVGSQCLSVPGLPLLRKSIEEMTGHKESLTWTHLCRHLVQKAISIPHLSPLMDIFLTYCSNFSLGHRHILMFLIGEFPGWHQFNDIVLCPIDAAHPCSSFPLSIGYVGAPSRWKRQVHIICWCDISATARKTFVTKLLEEIVGVNSVVQVRLVQILATGAPFHTLCRNPVIVKGQVDIIQTTLKALQVYHVFNEGHDWQQFLAITASSQPTMPPSSFFELLSIFLVEVFKSLPPSFLSSSQVVRHSP